MIIPVPVPPLKLLRLQPHLPYFSISQTTPLPPPHFLSPSLHKSTLFPRFKPTFNFFRVSKPEAPIATNEGGEYSSNVFSPELEDLSPNGVVYKKTLALVECSMFAALTGLVYFLSNSLSIENYFGCVFSLPIVISSMRWGIAAGRKTMVATTMLLLVLSGPVKALTYLLKHGIVGLTMGTLWRLGANWTVSILSCTTVRAIGAVGYVLISSFLLRENILSLITINIHASLTFMFTALGVHTIPSMNMIYAIFTTLCSLPSLG
ncbi:uncharacterized protein LOC126717984 isoform X3 [Quercus robur]|uniref:uncharacterized protein LOC115981943 isoform X4 n=1 Tax=Quercus lobata TaxID=97700 RepID=UPI00124468DF|nr:uncharacterized protein LOC115981943 isoform X4 [Quercus lobata]XP_050275960.1 uncharacterized protein LOC126717984 isoform X3 [Quercus robur]